MTQEQFVGILVGTFTIGITVLMLAAFEHEAESKAAETAFALASVSAACVDPTERERVRTIALEGIDKGLQQAVIHLFDVWQRDPEVAQPKRAQTGLANAISAHTRARQLALAWAPTTCPSEK